MDSSSAGASVGSAQPRPGDEDHGYVDLSRSAAAEGSTAFWTESTSSRRGGGDELGAPSRARFVELAASRCAELLGTRDVGRIAWQAADGPQIFPVSYGWHEGAVVFRTSPYGVLSELVRSTAVVLEVDELDLVHRTGWTVVVHGRARAVAEPQELVRLWALDGAVP